MRTVTKNMGLVVRDMDRAMETMNLEKVCEVVGRSVDDQADGVRTQPHLPPRRSLA